MDSQESGREITRVINNLEALATAEEAMADFYQACAAAWPEEREFWSDLAVDQVVQATRLHLMQQRIRESAEAAASVRIFPPAAVTSFIAWVKTARARVGAGGLDHRGALAIARGLEQSPILNEHFRVTAATEAQVAQYLLGYATEYGVHEHRLAERLREPAPALVA